MANHRRIKSEEELILELKENMSAMEVRLFMKDKGWDSQDSLSKTGWVNGYGYSIWFERWDWHGIRVGKVCIHAHTNDLNQIDKITYDTATKALKAWDDFTDAVPHQMADNNLKNDPIQTPFFRKSKEAGKIDETELEQMYNRLIERD